MFEFPNTRRAVLEIAENAGKNVGTQLPHGGLTDAVLPFHHFVMMPGSEQPQAPFATHRFQVRTYHRNPDDADDAALDLRSVFAGGPFNTSHGQIDEIRRTATPVQVDTQVDSYAQFNSVYEADVRAL